LDVTTDPVGATSTFHGGIALNEIGQVHITGTVSANFANGMMVSPTGQLVFSANPIVGFKDGYPIDAAGALRGQTDTVPDPKDPFVGGIRVGPLGGIYTTLIAPPVGDPPVNTVPPDITGNVLIGQVLTCSNGTWTGAAPITYTYQWYRGATPIPLATANTYTIVTTDQGTVLLCQVTATNAVGAASEFSEPGVRVTNARYDYKTLAGPPATGQITSGSSGAPLQVRVSNTDKDGLNHAGPLSRLRIGDSLFVGTQEGVLTELPIDVGSYTILEMVAWPLLADGEYAVHLAFN
jgi:hypothetical protein